MQTRKAKEKAKELVDKIVEECLGMELYLAKQCALICVDEMEKSAYFYDYKLKKESHETFNLSDRYFQTYWEEVKQEIEKL